MVSGSDRWRPALMGADQFTARQLQLLLCTQWPLIPLSASNSDSSPQKRRTENLVWPQWATTPLVLWARRQPKDREHSKKKKKNTKSFDLSHIVKGATPGKCFSLRGFSKTSFHTGHVLQPHGDQRRKWCHSTVLISSSMFTQLRYHINARGGPPLPSCLRKRARDGKMQLMGSWQSIS